MVRLVLRDDHTLFRKGIRAMLDTDSSIEYAFVVDGGDPLPDPRSAWQPFGVHGPSRTVDHASFRWTDDRWQAARQSDILQCRWPWIEIAYLASCGSCAHCKKR